MTSGLGHWYVEIEKQAYWRTKQHTWVNRYVMSGADPTVTDATTVMNALKVIEDHVNCPVPSGAGVGFVQARAYGSSGGAPFAEVNFNTALTPSSATGFSGPTSGAYASLQWYGTLENCLEVRTLMTGLSSRGKPIYARKFFRGIIADGEAKTGGAINTGDIATINGLCLPWKTGVGGTSYVVIGTSGRLMSGVPTAQSSITNHQVPRGRKKKSTALATSSAYSAGYTTGAAVAIAATDGGSSGEGRDIFGDRGGFQFPPTL